MYQALYRKWRPLVFSDVTGQPHITETLRRQVETGRLSHAYLFTGTRGTGKTTCAKILARAVNCEHPEGGNPCNNCPACLGILEGSIPDIAEIDAASNSGVDNIRSLREESVYTPVAAKKRVYIIDEVHMLSTGAFNALLKTLEEPPAHVMFILATTETHKVPATILSRCQRFAFKRISQRDITDRLLKISASEGIDLKPDAAALLARLADGALRDGLSLLDQCASQSSGRPIDTALVGDIVGLAGRERTAELANFIARNDLTAALAALDGLVSAGKDLTAILDELSLLFRDALLSHLLPPSGDEGDGAVDSLKAILPRERLISAILTLQESQTRLPASFNRRLEAELCVIKLCGEARVQEAIVPAAKRVEYAVKKSDNPTAEPARLVSPITEKTPVQADNPATVNEPPPEADTVPEPGAEISERRPAGERFRKLLSANAYFKSFLEEAHAEELNGRLYLDIKDPMALHMLRQKDFETLVGDFYLDGVEFISAKPTADAKKRLSDFKAKAGGLVSEDKQGGE